jgi:hypothetical protein
MRPAPVNGEPKRKEEASSFHQEDEAFRVMRFHVTPDRRLL